MPELITSPSNPLIKQARVLRQKKARDESKLFLVEGILHVGAAAEEGWAFEALLYAPDRLRSEFGRGLVEKLAGNGVRCQALSEAAFESFAEKDNPQGLAAIIRQKQRRLDEFAPQDFRFGAALVSAQDPGNVGTILRTLDAVGADGLILLGDSLKGADSLTGADPLKGADPYHPSAVRASMGTLFSKPFAQASFDEFIRWVRRGGYRLIGASARGGLDYRQARLDERPAILLLGSEQKGLTPEQVAACDELLSLPMRGRASSLNLAVAAGILLYALKG